MKIDGCMTHAVKLNEAVQKSRFGFKTNGNEQGRGSEFFTLAQSQTFNGFATDDFRNRCAGNPVDLVIFSSPLDERSTRGRLFGRMNDRHLACNTCKKKRFIQSCVAAADHRHRFVREEGAITGRAAGNAEPFELDLAFDSEVARISPGSDDHALRAISIFVRSKDKRFVLLFDRGDLKVLHLCAKLE